MVVDNKIQLIREKLDLYNHPFIEIDFLNKIMDKFSVNYEIKELSRLWLITPVINWKLYINNLYRWTISDYAILWQYMKWKTYMIWWLFLYNQYWFTTQLANWITVYNLTHNWNKEIGGSHFIFKKASSKFFWWKERRESQWQKYYCMSRERALIELILEKKWKLEFWDRVAYELNHNIDVWKLLDLAKNNLNKKDFYIVESCIDEYLGN